jgi:hypothetical protein
LMPKGKELPIKNLILASLPHGEYARLLPHLEFVALPIGEKLYKSGDVIQYVYFPSTALVSLVTHMKGGLTIASAGTGWWASPSCWATTSHSKKQSCRLRAPPCG